jgi:tellurite resistance protein TerC
MARHREAETVDLRRNPAVRLLQRFMPITDDYVGQHLTVRRGGRRFATPMLAVLAVIETTDIIFAVDSIPAIFAVTDETFIVFTSTAFAMLGLRALYFLLAGVIDRFVYLKPALAVVLVLVGVKMLLTDIVHVPVWLSLTLIIAVLTAAITASVRHTPRFAG